MGVTHPPKEMKMSKKNLKITLIIMRVFIIVASVTFGIAGYIKMDRDYDFTVSVLDQVGYSNRYVNSDGKSFEVIEYSPSGQIFLAVNKTVGEMFLRDFHNKEISSKGLREIYGPEGDNVIVVSEGELILLSVLGMITLIGFVFAFPIGVVAFWVREGL